MANATINTRMINVTDSQATTLVAALDGIPNTVSTIITDRTFTPSKNYKFTKLPHVSFIKTSDPNRYSYTTTLNTDGSYSFRVKYHHALAQPTTDVIEFFSEAKTNSVSTSKKVFGWNMRTTSVSPYGEARVLRITGDPGSKVVIKVTQNPRIFPISSATDIVVENTVTIDKNGLYETVIQLPKTVLATSYRVIISEGTNTTFASGLTQSPTTIFLDQWPLQQTKLEIIETGDTSWGLPAASVNNAFYYFSGPRGSKSYKQDFSWTVTHANNISVDQAYVAARFTQVTGQSSTLSETTLPSIITYDNLNVAINNTGVQSVVISGKISIVHGYDSGGHTSVKLNINDILNHA
jgi:hypothetical protein|tara:strand:+ start:1338 stop:2390 length:1053 start_codon:yes stop_codon:yes gene_type:complete